ncbi:helix-turn-helix domain-containing protein [Pseudonocardia tropica]|uniref:Helix-turn-helix domain-containing protein n=1 Tax=Pseudonocardia tropica TaxID=681289 RepID=A0ABV1K137_9PSEU
MADAVAVGVLVDDARAIDTVVDEFSHVLPFFVHTVIPPGGTCIMLAPEPGSPHMRAVDDASVAYVARGLGALVRQVVVVDHGPAVAGADDGVRILHFMEWLRARGRPGLVRSSDLWNHYVVARLKGMLVGETDLFDGKVAVLDQLDATSRSDYVASLEALIDSSGDVAAAAESMFLHPNTLRYRLRRIAEITGLDLNDPVDRFVVELQIRLRFSRSR